MITETNPEETPEVEDVLEAEDEGSTETETPDNSDEPEEGDEEPEAADEETIDWDEDGKTYKVPAALKDHLLRQGDYTRKTQELAAERKELASLKEEVQKASEAEVNAKARTVAIDAALKQYENVDWGTLRAQNPDAALGHWMQYQQLKDAKAEAETEYATAAEQRTLGAQQEAARRIEQGLAELQRDIPDWSASRANELTAFGVEKFGFTREQMEGIEDPKVIKILNYAYLASKSKQPKAQSQPELKPAAKIKGGVSLPKTGLDDRLSTEEWMRRRNEQARKAAR